MPPSAIMVLASPMRSFVTTMTFAPALSASMAAEQPAPPPPMMRTSVVVIGLREVKLLVQDARFALEQVGQLQRDLLALVGAEAQLGELLGAVVGMELLEQRVLFVRGHAAGVQLDVFFAGCFHLADGGEHVADPDT